MNSSDLTGRTAFVTGAFGGLGLHFARVLAAHGAKVALAGRRIELGRTVAAEIGAAVGRPGDVRAYALDVTDAASVADAIARIGADLGAPAIVVNNAGTVARAPSLELGEDAWRGVIDVNLSGVFRVAQASARAMVRTGTRGTIVNIASILGLRVRTPGRRLRGEQGGGGAAHPGAGARVGRARHPRQRDRPRLLRDRHQPRPAALAGRARRSSPGSRSSASASSPSSTGRCCCSPRTRRRT